MSLKEIYLYPDLVEFCDETIHRFRQQSRSICNFLERYVSERNIQTDGFKKVCIVGKTSPCAQPFINSSNVLVVEVSFDEAAYRAIDSVEAINDFFAHMLLSGFAACKTSHALPFATISSGLELFREIGYKNSWVFKCKKVKGRNYACVLKCRMTLENFFLDLQVVRDGQLIADFNILKTPPDETVFLPYLKGLKEENGKIKVFDRLGVAFYTTTLAVLDKL